MKEGTVNIKSCQLILLAVPKELSMLRTAN